MNVVVTGGIGSGKSSVAAALADMLSVDLVSADLICRDLLQVEGEAQRAMKMVCPASCFQADGSLNRPVLRELLFSDKNLRKKVDGIIHPLVRKNILKKCEKAYGNGVSLLIEIPLLFETGWQNDFDCSIMVYAEEETCVERIMRRDKVSKGSAIRSIAAQIPMQDKIKLADYWIDNSGPFAKTLEQLECLVEGGPFATKRRE